MARYLLPCPCGNNIAVEPRQAGESLRCSCGKVITAPPMLQIKALEPAPELEQPKPAASSWGVRQGVVLSGVLVVLIAVGLAVVLYLHRPVHPELGHNGAAVREHVSGLSPVHSWQTWQMLRQRGLIVASPQELEAYRAALLQWRVSAMLVGLLGVGGLALVVIGASLPRPGPAEQRQRE